MNLAYFPAFLATFISVAGLSRIAYKQHDKHTPRSLSELAVASDRLLKHFQKILWICGTLFAITLYGFLIPRTNYAVAIAIGWSLEYVCEMLVAFIPARGGTFWLHELIGYGMAAGMLLLAYAFCFSTQGVYAVLEVAGAPTMSTLAILTLTDKKRFLYYELAFIFFSHFTILIAVLATES